MGAPSKPGRRRALRVLAGASALGGLAAAGAAWRGGAGQEPPAQEWRGAALGAEARIVVLHRDPAAARAALGAAVAEIGRLEEEFSLFRPWSALSRLNRDGRLERPSLDMRRLLAEALRIGELTGGAFDVTVQPLWLLHALHAGWDPPPAVVAAARALVDHRGVDVGPAAVRLARPGMAVTLNGIAQGYITDRVTELLRNAGVLDALVDAGELRGSGAAPGGGPWRIGLDHPAAPGSGLSVGLTDAAVATSAGRGCPFTADASRHHIIDPRTGGCPPADRAVTVVAPGAAFADALATAMTVLPRAESADLVRRRGAGHRFRARLNAAASRPMTPASSLDPTGRRGPRRLAWKADAAGAAVGMCRWRVPPGGNDASGGNSDLPKG
jgi:thiamine biosynthesis lipoprotein